MTLRHLFEIVAWFFLSWGIGGALVAGYVTATPLGIGG